MKPLYHAYMAKQIICPSDNVFARQVKAISALLPIALALLCFTACQGSRWAPVGRSLAHGVSAIANRVQSTVAVFHGITITLPGGVVIDLLTFDNRIPPAPTLNGNGPLK